MGRQPRAEYECDYGKGRKNRVVTSGEPTVAVVLESDVARVFDSSAKVDGLLRSVIKRCPSPRLGFENEKWANHQMRPTRRATRGGAPLMVNG